jgi:hypothetical protein
MFKFKHRVSLSADPVARLTDTTFPIFKICLGVGLLLELR